MQCKQFWLVFSFLSIILLGLNLLTIFFCFQTYDHFFILIENNISINNIQILKLKQFITHDKLILIKSLSIILSLIISVFYIFKNKTIINFIIEFVSTIKNILVATYNNLSIPVKISIICISILKVILIVMVPLHLDEMFSYLFLSSKGIIVSFSYYPGPNNHVFFNILSAIFLKLPIPKSIAIRLPSFFADLFIIIICAKFIYQFSKNNLITIISLLIISFSINYLPYSISARGYALAGALGLIAFIANEKLKSNTKFYSIIYIVSNTLAFLTIPTHLYLFVSIVFFQVIIYKNWKTIFLINAITIILTSICYSPIILINGYNAFFNNSWIKSYSIEVYLSNIGIFSNNYISIVTGLHYSYFNIVYLVIILTLLYISKSKKLFLILFFYLIIPFTIMAIQRITPFYRVFIYLNLFYIIVLISYIIQNKSYKILIFLSILTFINNFQFVKNLIPFINSENKIAKEIGIKVKNWDSQKIKFVYIQEEKTAYQIQMYIIENELAINAKWQPNQELPFKTIK